MRRGDGPSVGPAVQELASIDDDCAGDHGRFALAYATRQDGQLQDARVLYSQLEKTTEPQLRVAVLYNAANTYLEQAAAIDREADPDRALPLIELAKSGYRAVLMRDHQHWGARHNLARALQWSPDLGEERLMELKVL